MEVLWQRWRHSGVDYEKRHTFSIIVYHFFSEQVKLTRGNYIQQMQQPLQQCRNSAPWADQQRWEGCDEPLQPAWVWRNATQNQTAEYPKPSCRKFELLVHWQAVNVSLAVRHAVHYKMNALTSFTQDTVPQWPDQQWPCQCWQMQFPVRRTSRKQRPGAGS